MHHSEGFWAEPMEFRPERFLDESGQCRKDFKAFLPFGIGEEGLFFLKKTKNTFIQFP
jgi:cytochrome P450